MRITLNWRYAPMAILLVAAMWVEYGPLIAVLLFAAGLGLGFLVEWRGRRRVGVAWARQD